MPAFIIHDLSLVAHNTYINYVTEWEATIFQGAWQAFRGISWEQTDIIFSTKVICASSDRKEVHVFVPPRSTSEEQKPSYILVGNPSRRACTIIRGNSIVAQVLWKFWLGVIH